MEGGAPEATFSQALAALKRRGSNLLVVGTTTCGAHLDVCSRLLGDAEHPRKRLLVFTDSDERLDERVGDADPTDVSIVDSGNVTRGTVASDAGSVPPRTTSVPPEDLDALGGAVAAEIDAFDGLDPAELRVCLDSLRPLLADHDEDDVVGFLHTVTDEVQSVNGMGHYHLPVAPDDPVVGRLAPLFDAVVEVHATDDEPYHRWHLQAPDLTTDWLRV